MTDRPDAQEVQEPIAEQVAGQFSMFDDPGAGAPAQDVQEATGGGERQEITIDFSGYDPRLDPGKPEFDFDAWREAVTAKNENGETALESAARAMHEIAERMAATTRRALAPQAVKELREACLSMAEISARHAITDTAAVLAQLREAMLSVTGFLQSDMFQHFREAVKSCTAAAVELAAAQRELIESAPESLQDIIPYLYAALLEAQEAGEIDESYTLSDLLLDGFTADGDPLPLPAESPIRAIIEQARAHLAEMEGIEAADQLVAEIEELPQLQTIIPTRHIMPNNALMNALQQKPAINAGPFDLVVANERGKRREITAYTMVNYDPADTGIAITDPNLSEYERQVSDAVISLWTEARRTGSAPHFTTDMVYRAMIGGGDKASPQQKGAITKAIGKLRRLHIFVDASEEMRRRGVKTKDGKPVTVCKFDDYYLSARRIQVKAGGQIVDAYTLTAEPIILTYSRMANQILSVDPRYINIRKVRNNTVLPDPLSMSEGRRAMTGYMLRRIAIMKHDKRNKVQSHSNIILFDTIFEQAGTLTESGTQTTRNRDFCLDVLDYWRATGYIMGYCIKKTGRTITGVEITI